MLRKRNHLFRKKIQELQKKLICTHLLSVKFCHLKNEKTGSIGLPHPEVILPSYPESTLVLNVFLDFSSFHKPVNTTSLTTHVHRFAALSLSYKEKSKKPPGPGYPNSFRTISLFILLKWAARPDGCQAQWLEQTVLYSSNASNQLIYCPLKISYVSHHRLSRRIFWIGVANFVLSPFIIIWVILYSFFTYAEVGIFNLSI